MGRKTSTQTKTTKQNSYIFNLHNCSARTALQVKEELQRTMSSELSHPHLIPFQNSKNDRIEIIQNLSALLSATKSLSSDPAAQKTTCECATILPSLRDSKAIIRTVSLQDVEILESNGCSSDDWSSVYFLYGGDSGSSISAASVGKAIRAQVKRSTFSGRVVLGLDLRQSTTQKEESNPRSLLKPGIHSNTMISNSVIEPGAKVFNNAIISETFIGSNATVLNCGSITYESSSEGFFSDTMTIGVGPEAGGGRPVKVIPESTLVDVCSSLNMSASAGSSNSIFKMPIECTNTIDSNVICGNMLHTNCAINVYLAQDSTIQSSSSVQNAILLPHSSIQNSIVDSVFLQWKSAIVNNSNVSSTLLMECSEIGPNSVVASTVLGPDSHVSCGEVHCSVIGPNTNSHHQSLLISVLWPTGRGNVGYGSNIGSNHTGRIPDQECTVGEGVFWGLGSVIKFPVDLSKSFYSVVAAGVQLPPQSVSMPFSLIMTGGNVGNGMNEIVPGWLLQSSPYTILRSEEKFKSRRKAKCHDFYCGWKIIRPTIVDACMHARNLLVSCKQSGVSAGETSDSKRIFTENDIIQIGKNYMTIRGIDVGIKAYTDLIQRYALDGLLELLHNSAGIDKIEDLYKKAAVSFEPDANTAAISWPLLPWEEASHDNNARLFLHKLYIMSKELPSIAGNDADELQFSVTCIKSMKKLIELENHHAAQVLRSKKRDDKRGEQTIPGYAISHDRAEDDAVVLLAQKRAKEINSKCNEVIVSLLGTASRL